MPESSPEMLVGRYRLLEVVGEGGMARVWQAEDTVLDRVVAIKILRSQFAADPEFLQRFQSEARAAAGLNHPGVVALHDVGRDGDRHFLVMEYVPGEDLKTRIRTDPPLATGEAVAIAAAVARALAHAHEVGLVHRDVKPQNVIITADGGVKVADFGIARAAAAAGQTAPGIVMGTVQYLSPEQASGGTASPASDVYSLGVVLYEMLTGRVPHEAESTVGVAMRIANEDPEPVDRVNPAVPAVLAGIVGKAMARAPEDRYADASALADALEGFARWSEQATAGLRAVPKVAGGEGALAPDTATASDLAPDATAGSAAAGAAPRRGRGPTAAVEAAPLLDRWAVVLAFVAFVAVAGLIVLWTTVLARVDPGLAREALGLGAPRRPGATATTTAAPGGGPEGTLRVPDLRGLAREEASRRLDERGLAWTVESEESVTATAGVVIDQRPAADAGPVPRGSVVRLVVAGEPHVEVPVLEGSYDEVATALLSLGLEPVRRERWGGAGAQIGAVIAVDPPPGSRLPHGSPVHVTVNSGAWMPLGVDFEDHLHLSGIDLAADTVARGAALEITVRWEATGDVEGRYRGVVALEGPAGTISADAHPPLGGARPTDTWTTGEMFTGDVYRLVIPPDAEAGSYTLTVALEREDGGPAPAVIGRGGGVGIRDGRVAVIAIEVE